MAQFVIVKKAITVHHFVVLGQSQAGGYNSSPALTTSGVSNVLTLQDGPLEVNNSGNLVQLTEGDTFNSTGGPAPTSNVETIATSLGQQLDDFVNNKHFRYVVTIHASGGKTITQLSKGGSTGLFEEAISSVSRVKTICDSNGWKYKVHLIWMHGGTGNNSPTPYGDQFVDLINDFRTDVIPHLHSEQDTSQVHVFADQQRLVGSPDYSIQLHEKASKYSNVHISHSRYRADYQGDNIHITSHGERYEGVMFARSIYSELFSSGWEELRLGTPSFDGVSKFTIPVLGASGAVQGSGNFGIQLWNDTDSQNESFTGVINGSNLELTLSSPHLSGTKNYEIRVKQGGTGELYDSSSEVFMFNDGSASPYDPKKYIVRHTVYAIATVDQDAPTDILLSSSSINEGNNINDVVGVLTSDVSEPNTYSLVSGTGDNDNASFNISGQSLRASQVFDYESKTSYSIRVRSSNFGGSFEKSFTININNLADTPPSDIALSSNSINENNSINDIIGSLTFTGDGSPTYSLISGSGDTDNASFNISGSNLRANEVFDFETKSSYSCRIQVSTAFGTYSESFSVSVNDVDETERILVDLGRDGGNSVVSGTPDVNGNHWNNFEDQIPQDYGELITTSNNASGISMELLQEGDNGYADGKGSNDTGANSSTTKYPNTAWVDSWFLWSGNGNLPMRLKFSGFDIGETYTIFLTGARAGGTSRSANVGNENGLTNHTNPAKGANSNNYFDAGTDDVDYNTDDNGVLYTITGVTEVTFSVSVRAGSQFAYVGIIDITKQ